MNKYLKLIVICVLLLVFDAWSANEDTIEIGNIAISIPDSVGLKNAASKSPKLVKFSSSFIGKGYRFLAIFASPNIIAESKISDPASMYFHHYAIASTLAQTENLQTSKLDFEKIQNKIQQGLGSVNINEILKTVNESSQVKNSRVAIDNAEIKGMISKSTNHFSFGISSVTSSNDGSLNPRGYGITNYLLIKGKIVCINFYYSEIKISEIARANKESSIWMDEILKSNGI